MTLKVLHSATSNSGTEFHRTEIFKFDNPNNSKTFKLKYRNGNGSLDLDCYVMNSDGVFQAVLNKYDFNFEFVSYVSSENDKKKNSDKAFKLAENVIVKIYG
jgi:hypothetical protein